MNLKLAQQLFLVCGASSGFGRTIAENLLREGANVIAVARREEKLRSLAADFPGKVQILAGDLTKSTMREEIENVIKGKQLHGVLLNSGGPPALSATETTMEQWDEAYQSVMRWKIDLVLRLVPHFSSHRYGRILFLESQSVKQPIPSLVFSNAFRAGVAGFAKSLSLEIARSGITVNLLAPGSHETPAIERVIKKKSEETGKPFEEVKKLMTENIPVGRMRKADELASLAAWLLSPLSSFGTGPSISHDGGNIKGLFG